MNYETDFIQFKENTIKAMQLNLAERIIIGISTYNQNVSAVAKRLDFLAKYSFRGQALFSYNFLKDNTDYLTELQSYVPSKSY